MKSELKFNKSLAEKFLSTIDPDAKKFSFYAFHRIKNSKKFPPRILEHKKLDDVWSNLCKLNDDGYGIYFCVNPIAEGERRKKNNISLVRAIWQEDDDGYQGKLPLKPHIEVESSEGKYHRYILTKKKPVENGMLEEFDHVMRAMVQSYGCDKNARDISRVLRVPGLYNTKPERKKDWFLVRVKKNRIKNNSKAKRYSWKKIKSNFRYSAEADKKINKAFDRDRLQNIINVSTANGYYEEMLSYAMTLANKGSSAAEIEIILEALLRQSLGSLPKEKMGVWEERLGMIPQFAESAVRKVREEGVEGSIDPNVFSAVASNGWSFIKEKIGELEYALDPPYLQMPSITMVHAITGLGKTFFNLSMGMALAVGADFLKWTMTEKKGRKVLYIDGEMTKKNIQDNMRTVTHSFIGKGPGMISKELFSKRFNKNFVLVNIDMLPDNIFPDLTLVENQKAMDNLIEKFEPEIVFIDNLSTVFKTAEDDQKAWQPVQDWVVSLRAKGISVVLIHHDNKTGEGQRGFSKKQDIINYAIHLKEPAGYESEMGARFQVTFTKTRDLYGESVKSFEAQLGSGENGGGVSTWTWSEESLTSYDKIVMMIKDEYKYNEICKELGVSKGTISHNVKKALAEGDLTDGEVKAIQMKRQPRRIK